MNKSTRIFSVFSLIILAIPLVSSQLISELNINKHEFAVNERLLVVVTVENSRDSNVYLQAHVLNVKLNSQLNTKSIEIAPQETKKIILYNFLIDDTYKTGDYLVVLSLVDALDSTTIVSKNVSFSITGKLEDFYFDIFACKDESCTQKSEIFTKEELIYLAFESGISNPTIIATLEYPDKSKEEITLPTFMPALQVGTYNLEATAFKQGYKTMAKSIQFSVIEKETTPSLCNNDGICSNNENYQNCQQDCPSGSADGYCDKIYDTKCDPDCSTQDDPDCLFSKNKPKEEKPGVIVPIGISLGIFIVFVLTIIISRKVQR